MTPDRRAAASRLTEAEQNRLIIENMKLVSAVAANYRGGSIAFEELVAIGREGLVKAARSFDPNAGAKFSTWAWIKIQSEIATALRRGETDWFPTEEDPPLPPGASYSNERVYEWDSWGRHGNANAIAEHWQQLPAMPEDLRQMYDELADQSGVPLSRSQRKLVRLVFVDGVSMDQAARDAQMSYYRMCRMLKRALRIMREESNLRGMTATVGGHCGVRERTAENIAVEEALKTVLGTTV